MWRKRLLNVAVVLAVSAVGAFAGCGKNEAPATTTDATQSQPANPQDVTPVTMQTDGGARRVANVPAQDTQVRLRTSAGDIVIRLYNDRAPRTVANFLDYARDGFYDGTVVHHAQSGLVIAGGCGSDLELKPTRFPILNEANNGLTHRRGTVAMARLPESAHSATSQFFFNVTDNPAFDHRGEEDATFGYCVFGEVVSGMEIVDKMAQAQTQPQGTFSNVPTQQIVLKAVEDMTYVATQQDNVPLLR